MNYRGWMFIGFSHQYPKGKIKARTFMNEECLVYRSESGTVNMVEPFCSHFGVNMKTGRVAKEFIVCPMHSRAFNGDGTCAKAKQKAIRSYPVVEDRGLIFAYFDQAGIKPAWDAPQLLDDREFPDVLWHHSRVLELHHPSVPQDNAVDPRHFQATHAMFGKVVEEGKFDADGHKALCSMAAELLPPLSFAAGGKSAKVTIRFDGPLNNYLQSDMGGNVSHMCNLLTIIEGKKCRLTQMGIGHRSRNPLTMFSNAVGYIGSWYATWEDAPVWNNRKPLTPDNYAHDTDKAIAQFREWFDSFAYLPETSSTHAAA